jgi:hypothetical protein
MKRSAPENVVADLATLREQGLLGGDLSRLNAHLLSHGWQLDLVWDHGQLVGVSPRRLSSEVLGGTNNAFNSGKVAS